MPFPTLLPNDDEPRPAAARRFFPAAYWRRYERPEPPLWRTALLHTALFLATLATTTLAGAMITKGGLFLLPLEVLLAPAAERWENLRQGLWFSLPFLGVLTVHEFGHYFTARHNRIRVTLPYFLPVPFGIGTFGAVIRIKEKIFSNREHFDVGLAGPLAGFLVALPLLAWGFWSLPPAEHVFQLHPDYRIYGLDYARYVYQGQEGITLSRPLLYQLLEYVFADPRRVPHPNELLHYPLLVAGSLSLFFTALNLLPIGQLDGGHILYGLLGFKRFNRLSALIFLGFIFYAGLGLFTLNAPRETWLYGGPVYLIYLFLVLRRVLPTVRRALLLVVAMFMAQLAVATALPGVEGNPGWLLFGLLLGRFAGIYHPPATDERPLTTGRKVLGWVMVLIFILCFSPTPFR